MVGAAGIVSIVAISTSLAAGGPRCIGGDACSLVRISSSNIATVDKSKEGTVQMVGPLTLKGGSCDRVSPNVTMRPFGESVKVCGDFKASIAPD